MIKNNWNRVHTEELFEIIVVFLYTSSYISSWCSDPSLPPPSLGPMSVSCCHEADGARAGARAVSGGQLGDHGVDMIGRAGRELWSDGWLARAESVTTARHQTGGSVIINRLSRYYNYIIWQYYSNKNLVQLQRGFKRLSMHRPLLAILLYCCDKVWTEPVSCLKYNTVQAGEYQIINILIF